MNQLFTDSVHTDEELREMDYCIRKLTELMEKFNIGNCGDADE
ncbi:MAG: hypothetical protein ACLUOI_09820 [Eisenbergiella sp.]